VRSLKQKLLPITNKQLAQKSQFNYSQNPSHASAAALMSLAIAPDTAASLPRSEVLTLQPLINRTTQFCFAET
jgi:hypothetical protein